MYSVNLFDYYDYYDYYVQALYEKAIKRQRYKHHMMLLPSTFAETIMPKLNLSQLQNKITRPSLNTMYNYEQHPKDTPFKKNCSKIWNNQTLEHKSIPYTNKKTEALKTISTILNNNKNN